MADSDRKPGTVSRTHSVARGAARTEITGTTPPVPEGRNITRRADGMGVGDSGQKGWSPRPLGSLLRWISAFRARDDMEIRDAPVNAHQVEQLPDTIVSTVENDATCRQSLNRLDDRTDAAGVHEREVGHIDRDRTAS